MLLFTIALLSQLSTAADPCTQLDAAYEELELMDDLKGEVAKKRSRKLLSLSTQCRGNDGGQRKSLEGYALAFSILQTGDSLPSNYCAALRYADELAMKLTKSAPKNGRIAKIRARVATLATNSTCGKESTGGTGTPVTSGKSTTKLNNGNNGATPTENGTTDGLSSDESSVQDADADTTDEPREVEGPKSSEQPRSEQLRQSGQSDAHDGGQHSPGNFLHLKRGVVAMGVTTGVSLAVSGILQGVTYAESLKVGQAIEDDKPPLTETDPCILGNVEQGAESYCGKLNDLKVATIVSWSLAGASALTTVALSVVYAKKRKKQRTAALTPKLQFGRQGVIWGIGGRF